MVRTMSDKEPTDHHYRLFGKELNLFPTSLFEMHSLFLILAALIALTE
jgi:hypothetical protein